MVLYLDADSIVTSSVDELFELGKANALMDDNDEDVFDFICVGDYFAGSVFAVIPSNRIFADMLTVLRQRLVFDFGEQDFLNFYFGALSSSSSSSPELKVLGRRLVLANDHYHCLAEDFGHPERNPNPTSTCKVVEFASCENGKVTVRWKPWMADDLLGGIGGQGKMCRFEQTSMMWEIVRFWRVIADS
jgi:hypothetical protein